MHTFMPNCEHSLDSPPWRRRCLPHRQKTTRTQQAHMPWGGTHVEHSINGCHLPAYLQPTRMAEVNSTTYDLEKYDLAVYGGDGRVDKRGFDAGTVVNAEYTFDWPANTPPPPFLSGASASAWGSFSAALRPLVCALQGRLE